MAPIDQKTAVIHILWDGGFGGIQRIVRAAFLDDVDSRFRHVAVVSSWLGPVIGPGDDRICLGLRNGFDFYSLRRFARVLQRFSNGILVYHLDSPVFRFFLPRFFPYVIVEHGCTSVRKKYRFINYFLGSRMYDRAGRIICVSRAAKSAIEELYPACSTKTVEIKNPVLIPFDSPRRAPHRPAVIGFVGRFSREKGPLEFVEMAKILAAGTREVTFKMIGDGKLLADCRKCAKSAGVAIDFTGFTNDIVRELSEMDILAVPSLADAFNMAVVEAMARGIPVVAYPTGGIPEIFENDLTGLLCTDQTPEQLAFCVDRLLKENGLYEKISANAFAHAKESYSLDTFRKNWEMILQDSLQRCSKH